MLQLKKEVYLNSLLILFLELALIRFLPSQIAYLGYYSNLILLASFVGIGSGILLAKHRLQLIRYFPWLLLILVGMSIFFKVSIRPNFSGEVHFIGDLKGFVLPELVALPIIFLCVCAAFIPLAQKLGQLFDSLSPLTAYFWDILGSLSGIALFTFMSFLNLNPVAWFLIISIIFQWMTWKKSKVWLGPLTAFVLVLLLLLPLVRGVRWSPYQKVSVEPLKTEGQVNGYILYVNNIVHQSFMRNVEDKELLFYRVPYQIFKNNSFERVLIVGSGTGNDVAAALKYGVREVDAVEIDPQILTYGKQLHPNKPYQDSRVTTYVTDARSFLEKTDRKYDLIVYALPDSLTLVSSQGNIRLESFLFTKEAFASAKNHLTENGALIMYNFYRSPWIVAKIAGLMEEVFQNPPYIWKRGGGLWWPVVFVAGPRSTQLDPRMPASSAIVKPYPDLPTDDWPFLYLLRKSLPLRYTLIFGSIFLILWILLSRTAGPGFFKKIEWDYFFMGAAFLLLETKSVIQFSLLFGATWFVNALVFFAILVLVWAAINFVAHFRIQRFWIWYAALGAALVTQYTFPLKNLLIYNLWIKYLIVSALLLAPIFIANVIFSQTFKDSKNNSLNFASNLLGAAVGAMAEYLALVTGYRQLVLLAFLFYLAAFCFQVQKKPILLLGRLARK